MKKYDLHDIMVKAWEFFHNAGGSFSECLKKAWKIAKMTAIGGREWEKGAHHRIYFNSDVIARLLNIEVEFYKSGNLSYAEKDGEKISNAEAGRYLCYKVFYDLVKGKFFSDSPRADEILETIEAAI